MAGTMSSVGKFKMQCLVRRMLAVVCEVRERPSHQAEDMGATFGDPSGLRVVMRTTGVPQ